MKDKMKIQLGLLSKYRTECMGLAFIFVLVVHSLDVGVVYNGLWKIPVKIFGYGQVGVNIFFTLSGMGMYYSLKRNTKISTFYVNRIKSIVPSYLCIAIPVFFVVDFLLDKNEGIEFIKDVLFIRYWLQGIGYWYVAIQIMLYLFIPFHNILCCKLGKFRWIMNLTIIVLSLVMSQLLYGGSIKTLGLLFERYAVFVAGYWIAEYVEKNTKIPFLFVGLLIIAIWLRRFLPAFLQDAAINVCYSITGFGICSFFSFCLERIKFLSKPFKLLGSFTLEFYMFNVGFNWVLLRIDNFRKEAFIGFYYWIICGLGAAVIAYLVHCMTSFFIDKKIFKV